MNSRLLSKKVVSSTLFTILFFNVILAFAKQGQTITMNSPYGLTEKCVMFPGIPGGAYSQSDIQKEESFCNINFHDGSTALCPKTWSTSPAIMLYAVPVGETVLSYEENKCDDRNGHSKVGKLKITMSEGPTSATYSKASMMYYHFSRFFDALVKVPVSVKRTVDARPLLERVVDDARGAGKMNQAAWEILRTRLAGGFNERNAPDLFAGENEIYGVMLKDKGERYGTEINGVRSAWGDAQNHDFQKTAAFTALRTAGDLDAAIDYGIKSANANSKLAADLAGKPSTTQMISWMQELTEITLLDYIFSQQDRIGNIDFEWKWVYAENGEVKYHDIDVELPRRKMSALSAAPAAIKHLNPKLIQKTWIGDNDAGGKYAYTNYTKRTKMLEGIVHYNSSTYRKLLQLNLDLTDRGPVYDYINSQFRIPVKELQMIVSNVALAAQILKNSCVSGRLTFDLDFNAHMTGQPAEHIDCNGN